MSTELRGLLEDLVRRLDAANVPFMVAGSFASTIHGMPRTTQDLDLVIAPAGAAELETLVGSMPKERYYVDRDAARDALRRRSMFNVIDLVSSWKVDFILRKDRAFSQSEFARRVRLTLLDVPVAVASAEDTIVAKLEWSKQAGGSERQRRDVAGILAASGDALDRAYVARWVDELDLAEEWRAAEATAL